MQQTTPSTCTRHFNCLIVIFLRLPVGALLQYAPLVSLLMLVPTSSSPYLLQTASIDWGDDNVPRSSLYGDVYYCREHGLAETRYVFLDQNDLPARFSTLSDNKHFTIAETGFGTGLNFLATWQLWREAVDPRANCRLHFVSAEKHPLNKDDLSQALSQWPELEEFSAALIENYPELIAGQHRLEFDGGRLVLDLLFADAEEGFASILSTRHPHFKTANPKVDAWFLDGFPPGSNPSMWSAALLDHVAALSKPACSFATFTSTGFVRRGLQARGFSVEKISGFGHKRAILRGALSSNISSHDSNSDKPPATFGAQTSKRHQRGVENAAWYLSKAQARPRSVVVVGAGLAGCHTAAALAKRGLQVTVLEQNTTIASGASGNPQAILYTKLSHQAGQLNQYALASFLYACRLYRAMPNLPGNLCGVLQLFGAEQETQFNKLRRAFAHQDNWCQFVDEFKASELAGLAINSAAVYFPQAGWLRPRALCEQLLEHKNIHLKTSCALTELHHGLHGSQERWQLRCDNGVELQADAVVVANSHDAVHLPQLAQLPLKTVRGQLTILRDRDFSSTPNTVICHEGYIAPPVDNMMILGASYDPSASDTALRAADNASNLEKLRQAVPSISVKSESADARAALRCTSPDYLPLAGPAPIPEQQKEIFAPLAKDAKTKITRSAAYYPGLYINVAHGSRGLTSTPLAAELLASQLCGEVSPLPRELIRALSPSRFLIRSLIRGR
ncbi:MAG: tRNA 5-methylaminomethyl-2-thiouridine biosynthesis bifunctional protein [Bacteroidia bacterium]|jgi:tRNA 5-methylaminomethyl-2-thiouridine biosynthesis bifunctional protein